MTHRHRSTLIVTALCLLPSIAFAQAATEKSVAVAGGGVAAKGWMGRVDTKEATAGLTIDNAKLAAEGTDLHVTTGPASVYWNPANTASGDYTVKATFTEPKYMSINSHPHPYGIVIGGTGMGTDKQTYLYCAAYGNGSFIVRGFGPDAFMLNGGHGAPDPAVHKAAGVGQPVTQEIAVSVKGGNVSCAINGKVVATYDKAAIVAPGKLTSTDGVYGIRFAHNTDGIVSGLAVSKP